MKRFLPSLLAVMLCTQCERNDDRSMRTLYEHDYSYKVSEFFRAAEDGNEEVVRAFLEFGMEPDVEDGFGNRSLSLAAAEGRGDVVKVLVRAGSELEHRNENGATPLLAGAGSGDHRVVEELLGAGADPTIRDTTGWGVLTKAVVSEDVQTVESLVRVVPDQKNEALLMAAVQGAVEVIEVLLSHGADIDTRSTDGMTPLMYASRGGYEEAVSLLVYHGANASLRNVEGERATDLAKSQKVKEVLAALR
ncbi:MAG: ankyrin repeat domain-containing protein [Verrucomicrobiota bacterium]